MDYDTHRHNNPVLPFWIRVFETVLTLAVESTGKRCFLSSRCETYAGLEFIDDILQAFVECIC